MRYSTQKALHRSRNNRAGRRAFAFSRDRAIRSMNDRRGPHDDRLSIARRNQRWSAALWGFARRAGGWAVVGGVPAGIEARYRRRQGEVPAPWTALRGPL